MSIIIKAFKAYASLDTFNKTIDALEFDYIEVMRRYRWTTVTPEKQQDMKKKLDPLGIYKNHSMRFSRKDDNATDPDFELPTGLFNISGMEFKVELEPVKDDDEKDWIDELLEDPDALQWLEYVDWLDRKARKKTLKHSPGFFKFISWCMPSYFEDAIEAIEKMVKEKMSLEDEEVT
jgi:hypothetical protein